MRLDFHTHGKLAKKLPFSTTYTDWLFAEARRAGLDALCLTEHFNTLQFDRLYGYLASVSSRNGDCLELENGLRIFPGMETDVAEGGHILSIGPLEAILELNSRLEPHKEKGNFLPFDSEGIDFAMTALFVVIFVEQWMEKKNRAPEVIGVLAACFCLQIFGADGFVLPAMLLITLLLFVGRKRLEGGEEEPCR